MTGGAGRDEKRRGAGEKLKRVSNHWSKLNTPFALWTCIHLNIWQSIAVPLHPTLDRSSSSSIQGDLRSARNRMEKFMIMFKVRRRRGENFQNNVESST